MDLSFIDTLLVWGGQRWFIAAVAAVIAALSLGFIWLRRRKPVPTVAAPTEEVDLNEIYRRYGTSETQRRRLGTGEPRPGLAPADAASSGAARPPAPITEPPLPPVARNARDGASPGAASRRKLVVTDGEKTMEVEFGPLPQRIGRHSDNDIVIDHPTVHRHHGVFALGEGNVLELHDLGGMNGVYVNGQRIDHHQMSAGDVVELGEVKLRYTEG